MIGVSPSHGTREVAPIDSSRERHRHRRTEAPPEPPDEVDGEYVQRRAGEILHLLALGQEHPVMGDDQRVGELDAEAEAKAAAVARNRSTKPPLATK